MPTLVQLLMMRLSHTDYSTFDRCVPQAAGNHPVPLKRLIGFERLSLPAGKSAAVKFSWPVVRDHSHNRQPQCFPSAGWPYNCPSDCCL